jgi:hypothetical protein
MSRIELITLSILLLGAAPTAAQLPDPDAPAGKETVLARIQAELRVQGAWSENFGQAPAGAVGRDLVGTVSDLSASVPLGGGTRLFMLVGGSFYEGFDPGKTAGGGIRWTGDGQALELALTSDWGVPRVDIGDELGFADVVRGRASWATRPWPAIQLSMNADVHRERYPIHPDRRSEVYEGGAALRFRGFGSVFSPEAGAAFSGRSVLQQMEDYAQRSVWLTLRTAPASWLYLSTRYRHRERNYAAEDPGARNFGRQDLRHQVTVSASVGLGRGWSWTTYYAQEEATSTLPSRSFETRHVSSGLAVRVR